MLKFIAIIALTLVWNGCDDNGEIVISGSSEGLDYEIVALWGDGSKSQTVEAAKKAEDILEARFEQANDDEASPQNSELKELFDRADVLMTATESAFDYRLGALRDAWNLDGRRPKQPEKAELDKVMQDLAAGQWKANLGLLPAGWAVDGAAEQMIAAGVTRGKVSLGNVTRVWGGMRQEGIPWKVELPPLEEDSIFKIISPPDGAIAIFHPAIDGFEWNEVRRARVLDPWTGMPSDSAVAAVAWAPDATSAAAYAEAFFVMGRRKAFYWLIRHRTGGLYLIYPNPIEEGFLAEADPNLAAAVTDSLPVEK